MCSSKLKLGNLSFINPFSSRAPHQLHSSVLKDEAPLSWMIISLPLSYLKLSFAFVFNLAILVKKNNELPQQRLTGFDKGCYVQTQISPIETFLISFIMSEYKGFL
jgi:hypothetical protein